MYVYPQTWYIIIIIIIIIIITSLCIVSSTWWYFFFIYSYLQPDDTFSLYTYILNLMILFLYALVPLPDDGRMNDRHIYRTIINERKVLVRCVVWVRMLLTSTAE